MPKIRDVLRDVTFFADGESYAGQCNQVTLPSLQLQTEEMRAGGMDAPKQMDMGMQSLSASAQFNNVPVGIMRLFGKDGVEFVARGRLITSNGEDKGATARLVGRITEDAPGDWQPGSPASKSITIAVDVYKLSVDGEEVHHVDIENYIRVIDGVDMLERARQILGIG
ncbi:phage major tail tube protein [Salinisphaera orenii]|uniref:Major tail tube protein n=1 Tax=Salinisphaera orenii YIM 95161 TaxID=1051139 RepID=A0A423PRN8_9GAMM|nr:phage major tail tube protein [Salinisphaera halophila]ROO28243.1 hypothetical protein SAHL_10870 [Salinisphaera halophila YIM 95161]